MNYPELLIAAIAGAFLGAVLYHEVQRVMPVISACLRHIIRWCCRRWTSMWWVREQQKEESKPLD